MAHTWSEERERAILYIDSPDVGRIRNQEGMPSDEQKRVVELSVIHSFALQVHKNSTI